MGGFDLLWDDGPIFVEDTGLDYAVAGAPPLNNSFLGEHKFFQNFTLQDILTLFLFSGCFNDRKRQLKHMFKAIHANKKSGEAT